MLFLPLLAHAAPVMRTAAEARMDGVVREAANAGRVLEVEAFRGRFFEPPPAEGLRVTVEAEDAASLLDTLAHAGFEVEAWAGEHVQVLAPWGRLHELAELPGVRRVREAWKADPKGRVSEGLALTMEQDWSKAGFDGTGVRIGVVDAGFDRINGVAAEVPMERTEDYSRGDVATTAHGTAVTEVLFDFAPGATWYLATFSTETEFAEVLEWFDSEDVDVINASIGFDNRAHADGQSFVSRAVDAVVEGGAIYVAAAGNENERYRVGDLRRGADGIVYLAGTPATDAWTNSGFAQVSLRWSEPFGQAVTDLDLILYNEDGSVCGSASSPQNGSDDPYEIVYASGCSELVSVVITAPEGVDPLGLEGYLYAPAEVESAWTDTEDLTLPADAARAMSVGAWDVGTQAVPFWSSRGPTNDFRAKPDVVAPSGVSTATYGPGQFAGSSAAAPHIAGLAALWVDASNRHDQPDMFGEWVRAMAVDVEGPGVDFSSGAGRVVAGAPPEATCGCRAGQGPVGGVLLLLAAWVAARRRSGGLLAILPLSTGCTDTTVEGFWVEVHGRVVGEDGAPLSGAIVTLATPEGTPVVEVRTSDEGEWRAPLYGTETTENLLVALVSAEGYAEGRASWEVNLRSPSVTPVEAGPGQTWDVTSRQLAAVRLGVDADSASVSGRILDAASGLPVEGVPLSIQVGWNAAVGDVAVGAAESDESGAFSFTTTHPGMYTVTASETSETGAARFGAFLTAAGGVAVGAVGSPVLANQLRATLLWADTPSDLDLHLSAPLKGGIAGADGTGQYHLWSGDPTHPERAEADDREAWMERTDADGFGPESVWVDSLADKGEFRLSVFDADNRSDSDSVALAGSDAMLQVWSGEDTPRYFTVSPGEIATLWRPVEVDVSTLVTYQVEEWSFGAAPDDSGAF